MGKENTGWACLGVLAYSLVALIVGALLNGWVLTKLWAWFVAPVFGVQTLTLIPAIGLSLVVAYLTHQQRKNNNKGKDTTTLIAENIGEIVVYPLFVLLVSWVVVQFM